MKKTCWIKSFQHMDYKMEKVGWFSLKATLNVNKADVSCKCALHSLNTF
jgi:hypothetical protein